MIKDGLDSRGSRASRRDISILVLTYNEEIHLGRLLERLAQVGLDENIFVVDSYSTDATESIAARFGVHFYQHAFTSQSDQVQWAIDNIAIPTSWILRMDADELIDHEVSTGLADALERATTDPSINGFELNRRHIFMGKWIKHGGRYPLWLLRAWRQGYAIPDGRQMDEHMTLLSGRSIKIAGLFEDRNEAGLEHFSLKHIAYAKREVLASGPKVDRGSGGIPSSRQARTKKFLKKNVYEAIPADVAPFLYFILRYVFQFGFLDGRAGLYYHLLQALWYRSLVEAFRAETNVEAEAEQVLHKSQAKGVGRASSMWTKKIVGRR